MSTSGDSHNGHSPLTYEPVVPADLTRASYHSAMIVPPQQQTTQETRTSSESAVSAESGVSSLRSPRTARFAEATSIHSPIEQTSRSPFADPPKGVADVGFGYVTANDVTQYAIDSRPPLSPLTGLKVPNTAKSLNLMSPTLREEYILEKQEKHAEKENARDLKIKVRVRLAKLFLRFINFGCSLIVLSMLAVTLTVFETTKHLPHRNSLPAWAEGTNPWAQYMMLGISACSLFACIIVFYGYYRGGHHRAEKAAIYYTIIAVVWFFVSLIMWLVAAGIYQHQKATGDKKDMWGWSCAQNTREQVYSNVIDYALLCRLQDWGLVCAIIEVVLEAVAILVYAIVAWRFWSKRRLMKSMDTRDKARSDLYLAQLRVQSAPNTPGFPGFSSYPPKSPFFAMTSVDPLSAAEKGEAPATQYASPRSPTRPKPTFQLQAPPIRVQQATPRSAQGEFKTSNAEVQSVPAAHRTPSPPPLPTSEIHMALAPDEQDYGSVPVPTAYGSSMIPIFPEGHH
ncbi:hypothetical protein N7495_002895 [Penicillium taxi]|uniref:uncharacterized protein n=1 Tax=Penicillium taxi TaxID=168475 RepID=UPI002545375A|nr:uncharacterized protein N7495_002895 [Penicillium taxi]KAJ5902367.1 hypothetical protein N7495_002895 [Penicillium taxi]